MDSIAHSSLHRSRLVTLLSDLTVSDAKVPPGRFSERFGQLVDLSGSITLSMVHEELSTMTFKPTEISVKAIQDEFLRVRTDLVRSIAMAFVPGTGLTRGRLPTPKQLYSHCKPNGKQAATRAGRTSIHAAAYEPYRTFYVTRQRELDINIQKLRNHIGNSISGCSPALAQLSMLDKTIGKVLFVRTRELFALVPKRLGKHFGRLIEDHWQENLTADDLEQWMIPGGWISTFCGKMRELLLAELEVRLQPVLGMIDSLPKENTANHRFDEGEDQNHE